MKLSSSLFWLINLLCHTAGASWYCSSAELRRCVPRIRCKVWHQNVTLRLPPLVRARPSLKGFLQEICDKTNVCCGIWTVHSKKNSTILTTWANTSHVYKAINDNSNIEIHTLGVCPQHGMVGPGHKWPNSIKPRHYVHFRVFIFFRALSGLLFASWRCMIESRK